MLPPLFMFIIGILSRSPLTCMTCVGLNIDDTTLVFNPVTSIDSGIVDFFVSSVAEFVVDCCWLFCWSLLLLLEELLELSALLVFCCSCSATSVFSAPAFIKLFTGVLYIRLYLFTVDNIDAGIMNAFSPATSKVLSLLALDVVEPPFPSVVSAGSPVNIVKF